MGIDGLYYVYSQAATNIPDGFRLFGGEFSLMGLDSDGKYMNVYSSGAYGEKLTKKGAPLFWESADWQVSARLLNLGIAEGELMVGQAKRGKLVDVFVAIKALGDSSLLLSPASYTIYYLKDKSGGLTIQEEADKKLKFTFPDPNSLETKAAKAPSGQAPGRFSAEKSSGEYSAVGFRLPRFVRSNAVGSPKRLAVILGFLFKGSVAAEGDSPLGTDDIEPFVAVSTDPVPDPDGSPS